MSITARPHVGPLRVALVNDYEIVLRGLALMLRPYRDRVSLVELDARMPVSRPVDIALFDTHGRADDTRVVAEELMATNTVGKLVVYGWATEPDLERRGLGRASGFLSKGLTADELVSGLELTHCSEGGTIVTGPSQTSASGHDWPGRRAGLTQREGEIISLITQGLSNQAIADLTFLSINSVKSYIRTAYRKMAVTSRSQAVLWGVQHGFEPDRLRLAHAENVHQLHQPMAPSASRQRAALSGSSHIAQVSS